MTLDQLVEERKGIATFKIGLSASEKTSSQDSVTCSTRCLTRPMRPGEVDSREYDGSQRSDGYFYSREEFLSLVESGDIVLDRRFPDTEEGELYGFDIKEMRARLDRGEDIEEQIVDFKRLGELRKLLEGYETRFDLYLADIGETIKRLKYRDGYEGERGRANRELAEHFLDNLDQFDSVHFSHPKQKLVDGEELRNYLLEVREKIFAGEIEKILYDFEGGLINTWLTRYSEGKISGIVARRALTEAEMSFGGLGAVLFKTYPAFGGADISFAAQFTYQNKVSIPGFTNALSVAFLYASLGRESEAHQLLNRVSKTIDNLARVKESIGFPGRAIQEYFIDRLILKAKKIRDPELQRRLQSETPEIQAAVTYHLVPGLEERTALFFIDRTLNFIPVREAINSGEITDIEDLNPSDSSSRLPWRRNPSTKIHTLNRALLSLSKEYLKLNNFTEEREIVSRGCCTIDKISAPRTPEEGVMAAPREADSLPLLLVNAYRHQNFSQYQLAWSKSTSSPEGTTEFCFRLADVGKMLRVYIDNIIIPSLEGDFPESLQSNLDIMAGDFLHTFYKIRKEECELICSSIPSFIATNAKKPRVPIRENPETYLGMVGEVFDYLSKVNDLIASQSEKFNEMKEYFAPPVKELAQARERLKRAVTSFTAGVDS